MKRALALTGMAALLAVAACGGGGGGGSNGPPAGSVVVKLTEFKYDPNTITHKSGSITFFLENTGTQAHDMKIFDSAGNGVAQSDLVQPGNDTTFTLSITTPGAYHFYCTQPGHKDSGMTGTLTIT